VKTVYGFVLFALVQIASATSLTGIVDPSFNVYLAGGWANQMVALPDDRLVILGEFTEVNNVPRKNIARLLPNGETDTSFEVKNLDANFLAFTSLTAAPDGKIILTGWFTNFAGVTAPNIVRLNTDGSVDSSFQVNGAPVAFGGEWSAGITACAFQPDGKILIGGSFERIGRNPVMNMARLLPNGTVDATFNTDQVTNTVYSIAVQPDGNILVGTLENIIRLNTNGVPDRAFATANRPGPGAKTILPLPDGGILVTGFFYQLNGATTTILRLKPDGSVNTNFALVPFTQNTTLLRDKQGRLLVGSAAIGAGAPNGFLMRLNADGTPDLSFDFGSDLDGTRVFSTAVQQNGRIVISYEDHTTNHVYYKTSTVRLFETNATSVVFFDENNHYAMESNTNITFNLRRAGNVETPLAVNFSTEDDTAKAGVHYVAKSGSLNFAPGEHTKEITIPLIDDRAFGPSEVVFKLNVQPAGDAVVDPDRTPAVGHIQEADWLATLEFQSPEIGVNEEAQRALVVVHRPLAFGFAGELFADFKTEDITARAGVDYEAKSGTIAFSGYPFPRGPVDALGIEILIYTNSAASGPRSFKVTLSNPRVAIYDLNWQPAIRVQAALDQNAVEEVVITDGDLWFDKKFGVHNTTGLSGFTLEASTNLLDWTPIHTNVYLTPFSFTEPNRATPAKFYRRR
jgi:uncharacterized delta-60 repeat protein